MDEREQSCSFVCLYQRMQVSRSCSYPAFHKWFNPFLWALLQCHMKKWAAFALWKLGAIYGCPAASLWKIVRPEGISEWHITHMNYRINVQNFFSFIYKVHVCVCGWTTIFSNLFIKMSWYWEWNDETSLQH